jgi:hypothetical protein
MEKILSDNVVLADFASRPKKSPFADFGEPEVVDPFEIEHAFEIRGTKWICGARAGGEVVVMSDQWRLVEDFTRADTYTSAERDELQNGIDKTLELLRAKHGKPIGVVGGIVPRDWPE